MKISRASDEVQFAAVQRQAIRAQTEHERALQERAEQIAKLRTLRLAKEAADRERAGNASTTKAATEAKKSSH